MVDAIDKKEFDAVLTAETKEVAADSSVQDKYKTMSTYTTTTTSNSNRNENIRLAVAALNGMIVKPGQEFSFNNTTGARTEEKGYKPATAYLNGEVVQEPGGGVCQVSSTLYNAVVFSGLKVRSATHTATSRPTLHRARMRQSATADRTSSSSTTRNIRWLSRQASAHRIEN